MKLKAFRIQNFRSIIDTGFQDLSPDNITAIIGQNESGKTSILEGLAAFDDDWMTSDDLRNDNSIPVVTCIYSIEDKEFHDIFEPEFEITHELVKIIKSLDNCISLQKVWDVEKPEEDPVLEIENAKLRRYFEDRDNEEDSIIEGGAVDAVPTSRVDTKGKRLDADEFVSTIYDGTPVITLFEDKSLLPPIIDIVDLQNKNEEADGYVGAKNFLSLTGLTIKKLANHQKNERMIRDEIDSANFRISKEFQDFWSQFLGSQDKISIQAEIKNYDQSVPNKIGQPYLSFWIKDGNGSLRPIQRSMGVRWFISFFLTLKATAKKHTDRVMLIDEAGANLHAKAQEDILKILESEKENLQIIYATHSPYLLNVDKIYRVLAVERGALEGYKTITKVYKFHDLGSASSDTLFPLYTNMGVDISHQQVIKKERNVLLEEISAYFYLKAFWILYSKQEEVNFLPATGCTNVPLLANLLLGWGLSFSVLLDDDRHGRVIFNELKSKQVLADSKLIKIKDCDGIEDIFSKIDFSKFVLNDKEVKIPEEIKNSKYVKDEDISKPIVARDFLIRVEKGAIKKSNMSSETQTAIKDLLDKIVKSL